MQSILENFGQIIRRSMIVLMVTMLIMLGFVNQPSFAQELTPEEKIDRAYEESEATGIAEEIYQQRLKEGQNPEKMPKPFKHIVDLEGKEVPDSSITEKAVAGVREAIEKVTGK